jgi:AbrB family looped-hinge helix DNA binding protein
MEYVVPSSKVTRKGQVTIPQSIREALGIREGDIVQVALDGDLVIMRRLQSWRDLAGCLRDLGDRLPPGEAGLSEALEQAWVDDQPR